MKRFHSLLTYFFLLAGAALPCASVSAATVTIDGGTYTQESPYTVDATTSDDFVFTNGGWLSASTAIAINGTISGEGNVILNPSSGRPQIQFNRSMSGFSGTVTTTNQAWFSIRESNYGSENADFVINSTGTGDQVTGILLDNINTTADNPVKFGSISGNGWIRPMGNQGKDFYIEVGGTNTNASFSGLIPTHNNDSVYITKVGTGNWTLSSSGLDLKRPLTIKEGTVTIGNGANDGKLSDTTQVIVEENGTLQYSRTAYNYTIDRNESILLKGGTLKNIGPQKFTYTHLTVENAGTLRSTTETTLKDLVLTGEAEDARFTIDGSGSKVYMTGSITGGDNQEIYFTSVRGNFMYIQCDDVSGFSGTITAGPATNTTLGTWISLNGATTDFSTVTLNPNPGKIKEGADAGKSIDSGILLEFDPTGKTLQVGAISGDGIFRSNGQAGKTFTIQTGAKNIDTTFSGSFSRYENSNYAIEKVGTGTWTITSDYEKYYASSPIGNSYKNNYTGNTTITEGTIQIGDGGDVGHLGAGTDPAQMTKIIIGENGTLAINRSGQFTFYNNIESAGAVKIMSTAEGDYTKLGGTVTGTLNKTGDGTLLVTDNKLTGVTKFTVTEGKLQFGNGENSNTCAYTSNARSFELKEGGTLAFNYAIQSGDLSISGNLASENGTIEVDGEPAGHVALRGAVSGSFIKTGTGALAMGSSNGANLKKITLKEGILRNYGADRLGNGATEIVLDGGIFSQQNPVTLGNKFTVVSDSRFENPVDVVLTGNIAGETGVLTKTGAGTLIISGGMTFTGGYVIEGGTIQCGNNDNGHINNLAFVTLKPGTAFGYKRAADPSVVPPTNVFTVDGAKLFNSGARAIDFKDVTMKAGGMTLENTGTSTLTANVKSTENGVLTFKGTTDGDITANLNASAATQNVGGLASANDVKSTLNFTSSDRTKFLNLNGDLSTFTGDINVTGNCWIAFNSGNALGSEKASFNLAMTSDSGILIEPIDLDNKTIEMGDLTGTGWVRSGNNGKNVTVEVGDLGNDSTFSGAVRNWQNHGITVKKVGDGNWTLASENQANGVVYDIDANVIVSEGTLTLNRKTNQASANNLTVEPDGALVIAADGQKITGSLLMKGGSLTVADGKSLPKDVTVSAADMSTIASLSGTVDGNITVTQGTIAIGTDPTQTAELTANKLTLSENSGINMKAVGDATDRLTVAELLLQEGTEIVVDTEQAEGETITLDLKPGSIKLSESTINLADLAPMIDAGDYSVIYNDSLGMIQLVMGSGGGVPEPATWMLLLLGFGGLLAVRRTVRKA